MRLNVSRETQDKWSTYKELLFKWQESVNLVSVRTLKEADKRHFQDSYQLVDMIPEDSKVVDFGSGAGFPGLVVAMARPDCDVTLIEADSKKCAFLRTVSRETGTDVTILDKRIEDLGDDMPETDVITARALAPLSMLLNYALPFKEKYPDLQVFSLKGRQWKAEVKDARKLYDIDWSRQKSKTGPGVIIQVKDFEPKDDS